MARAASSFRQAVVVAEAVEAGAAERRAIPTQAQVLGRTQIPAPALVPIPIPIQAPVLIRGRAVTVAEARLRAIP